MAKKKKAQRERAPKAARSVAPSLGQHDAQPDADPTAWLGPLREMFSKAEIAEAQARADAGTALRSYRAIQPSQADQALYDAAVHLTRIARSEPNAERTNLAARLLRAIWIAHRRGEVGPLRAWLKTTSKQQPAPRHYPLGGPTEDEGWDATETLPPLTFIDRPEAVQRLIHLAEELRGDSAEKIGERMAWGVVCTFPDLCPPTTDAQPSTTFERARLEIADCVRRDRLNRERSKLDPEQLVVAALRSFGLKDNTWNSLKPRRRGRV